MNDYILFVQSVINVGFMIGFVLMGNLHRRAIQTLQAEAAEERKVLLDRIMANNIHEFKAASGQSNVKRSENSNFLKDRMENSVKQYIEID